MNAEHRIGDCFQTYSGNPFYPLDPRPEEVLIDDIAHALSNVCRFGGHCTYFYSVAQHSVRVSELVPKQLALQALLHDAAEAYIGDMVKPFKNMMPAFESAESIVFEAVAAKFKIPAEIHPLIKAADRVMLATEARDLMHGTHPVWRKWLEGITPLETTIYPLPPSSAAGLFLTRFNELMALQ